MKQKAAIVIPTYKSVLSETEEISLKQAIKIFQNEKKFFVLPASLQYGYETAEIEEVRLDDKCFQGVRAYNDLMLSEEFYRRFSAYEYVLIYQLDAFVFSNELERFCSLGYDYIGAPWIDGTFYYRDSGHTIWYVGNGGFSLRKVDSFLNLLSVHREDLVDNHTNEDLILASLADTSFCIAPMEIALEFAFEMNVKESYKRNRKRLPFGCHAWSDYDLAFWKPWIEKYGYCITEKMFSREQKDIFLYDKRKKVSRFWLKEYKKENLVLQISELFDSKECEYAIWGAGHWGQTLCRMLDDAELNVVCFIDRQIKRNGHQILGREVITPEMIAKRLDGCRIIVAVMNEYKEIVEYLESCGYEHYRDYIHLMDINILADNVIF